MPDPTHDDLTALQAALTRLTPAPDGIDLGRLLYRAGQASVPRHSRAWPWATAAATLLAAALGAVLLFRPAPPPTERIVVGHDRAPPDETPVARQLPAPGVPPDAAEDADRGRSAADSFRLRQEVLARGVDALPAPTPWPAAARRGDADTLLDLPRVGREPRLPRLKDFPRSGDAS
jgi:hypothetical protein